MAGAFMPAQGGLLGGDANTGAQNNFAGLFSGWHNRGYGIPGQTAPGQTPPTAPPQSYTPPPQSPYGLLNGLFGGYM
jgi:hypothetical protein